jgi:hypothetical protein
MIPAVEGLVKKIIPAGLIWGNTVYGLFNVVPLSYDLTPFQLLGQKFFVVILVAQMMTPKGHFEINWPLVTRVRTCDYTVCTFSKLYDRFF